MKLGAMKIKLHEIPIRDVVKNFFDDAEKGCRGYGGKLNIRPAFQREFVYSGKQRDKVIETVKNNFPLNVMYWVKNSDGTFEMLDGQQRTISICQYVNGEFVLDDRRTFDILTPTEQKNFLDYKLMIYICEGDDTKKLDWFETINIAGEKLTEQEMRNAIFASEWLSDAKKFFSKTNCFAQTEYGKFLNGSAIRQDFLETALKWIVDKKNLPNIRDYMAEQKSKQVKNCDELRDYFEEVFDWVQKIFPIFRAKLMKGQQWGLLYNKYSNKNYDTNELEEKIKKLLKDFDVTNQRGIYEYLLGGEKNEKLLNIRQFDARIKSTVYERQKGICPICKKHFELEDMHADHIIAWSKGGKTVAENCQMLCADCNRKKSNY